MPWTITLVGACFLAFGLLSRRFACNPGQPAFFRKELGDDVLYYMINLLFYSALTVLMVQLLFSLRFGADAGRMMDNVKAGYGALARLPVLVQAFLVLLFTDIMQYWLHRAFHTRWMWPFHAVHHSPEQLDWTTTFRNHPVNHLIYTCMTGAVCHVMGFQLQAFLILAPANFVHAGLVHANLNWDFGPFRYVLASPVFHRWHHVSDPEVRDKNFAPTFPVLDLMFGTFYMPKGRLPEHYGAEGVPQHFVGQMIYPFREILSWYRTPRPRLDPTGA